MYTSIYSASTFFFFQAEDGIRDIGVTGVQTCALPISPRPRQSRPQSRRASTRLRAECRADRKSTRLNSSHANISYAVFCLKKKKFHQRFNPRTHHGGCRSVGGRQRISHWLVRAEGYPP